MEHELYHYGILGMKWGIRRYQDANGRLTPEGRKRARQEYRADNKKAFQLGKEATIAAKANRFAAKNTLKAVTKYYGNTSKNGSTITRKYENMLVALETGNILAKQAAEAQERVEAHHKELQEKYGKDAISDIRRDKYGKIDEEVVTTGQLAVDAAITTASIAGVAFGKLPVGVIVVPRSARGMGYSKYRDTKYAVKQGRRQERENRLKEGFKQDANKALDEAKETANSAVEKVNEDLQKLIKKL